MIRSETMTDPSTPEEDTESIHKYLDRLEHELYCALLIMDLPAGRKDNFTSENLRWLKRNIKRKNSKSKEYVCAMHCIEELLK